MMACVKFVEISSTNWARD